jgi:hypothetical protein
VETRHVPKQLPQHRRTFLRAAVKIVKALNKRGKETS